MTSRFRPIWPVLDPFIGTRALLGMLVACESRVEFVPAADAARGLRSRQQNIVDLAVEELAIARSFEHLPIALGPQLVLGAPRDVPCTVDAPAHWVAERLMGREEDA